MRPGVMRLILRRSAALVIAATMAACSSGDGDAPGGTPTGPSPTPAGPTSPPPTGSPSQPSCAPTIPDLPPTIPTRGGSYVLSLLVASDCVWSATAQAEGWANISPNSGRGSATPTLRVLENVRTDTRTLLISVNGQTFRTVQEGVACIYTLDSPALEIGQDATTLALVVTAPAGCAWTAVSSERWLTVRTPSGVGSGTINLDIPRNTGDTRQAFVTVANHRVVITQRRSN
jgi:hypothetical protein